MGGEAGAGAYRVGRFTLDIGRGALLGHDGAEVPLRPKPFSLLCHLARHAGRVQSHDEILAAVWPGVFVTEDSVTLCVRQLRLALGDTEGGILRTVPRRGYLLAAEAVSAAAPAPLVPGLPDGAPTLRVEPLEVLGDDPSDARLAAGLAADLTTALARMRWLAVEARDAEGAASGPRYVLRGLLRRAGGDARVTAELLPEGSSKLPLWSGSFDAPAGESPFAQGDHLVASMIAAVEPALRLVETERVRALPPGHLLTEHEADRRAYTLMRPPNAANCRAALAVLEAALERYPGSPMLLSAAAYCRYWMTSQHQAPPPRPGEPTERERVIALAEAALAGSANALVLIRVAVVFSYLQHREQFARGLAERALELMPYSARVRTGAGWVMLYCDEPETAVAQFSEALRLDAIDANSGEALAGLSFAQLTLGRTAEAVESGRRAVALSPDQLTAHRALVAALGQAGQPAADAVAELLARDPRFNLSDYLSNRLRDANRPLFTVAKDGMRRAGIPERAPPERP
jgi:DNA-binding winged helix-turn-helix (wHTH) protein/tetratricopeptide (TPR) repeat protein